MVQVPKFYEFDVNEQFGIIQCWVQEKISNKIHLVDIRRSLFFEYETLKNTIAWFPNGAQKHILRIRMWALWRFVENLDKELLPEFPPLSP